MCEKDTFIAAYKNDAYSNRTMHVISSQYFVRTSLESKEQEMTSQKHVFGYLLLSSFSIDLTCREVWDRFYDRVSYIFPDLKDDSITGAKTLWK